MAKSSPQAQILLNAGLPPHQVLVPGDPNFASRQASYWSKSVQALQPGCIVQPDSTQDVVTALQGLTAANIPFAVRSGGHTGWAGANNIGPNGVTIDLHLLDQVQVVQETKQDPTVNLGPGNRWARVYTELAKDGLAVAGGREGNVGVAGLLLGGGMAFYTARYGLACDNVVEYEVVLADGRVVYPREGEKEHADLFRALKGGGINFGIVTNFRMRTLQASPIWGGMTVHPKENTPDAIKALVEFTDGVEKEVDSNLLCFFTYTGEAPEFKEVVVAGALIQVAGVEEAPAYKSWLKMPTTASTCKLTTVPQLAVDYTQAQGYYNVWFTATFKNDPRIVSKAAELHEDLVAHLKALIPDGDFVTQCLFQPFPALFGQLSKSRSTTGNILGIDKQSHSALLWLAVAQVRTPELERIAHGLVGKWVEAVKSFAASLHDGNGNLPWMYLNYADGTQDPLSSYGPENLRFMRAVARKYDPNGVFQTLCEGGFKLARAGRETEQVGGDIDIVSRESKI